MSSAITDFLLSALVTISVGYCVFLVTVVSVQYDESRKHHRLLSRLHARLDGRAATIRRLLAKIQVARLMESMATESLGRRIGEIEVLVAKLGAARHEIACLKAEIERGKEEREKEEREKERKDGNGKDGNGKESPPMPYTVTPPPPYSPPVRRRWWQKVIG